MSTTNWSNPEFLAQAYATEEGLEIRIRSHRRYSLATEDVFHSMTARALQMKRPDRILDIGAGTGNWYRTIREELPPDVQYTAMDQSRAMVKALLLLTKEDPHAEALIGDAEALPLPDAAYDWVGLHYMLYHVPDIRRALAEAWRVLTPGGILLAATNAEAQYRELREAHEAAIQTLGLPFDGIDVPSFTLESGGVYFPQAPDVIRIAAGLKFPTVQSALAYYASGPIHHGLSAGDLDKPGTRERLLTVMGDQIQQVIEQEGHFTVHSDTGYFIVKKPA